MFPGGVGDFNDFREKNVSLRNWIQRLMYYEDGRFARDKIFGFFIMNYYMRHQNQDHGHFYVNSFYPGCRGGTAIESLEELQEAVANGDTSFLDRIQYFGSKVVGSTSYWNSKRSELRSWINHHVEAGNGTPSFFITLSCAEYFWPDVMRLLNERRELANLPLLPGKNG